MRCLLAVCADSAVVDQSSNRLSLFNVIDSLAIEQFPVIFSRITPVFIIERDDGEAEDLEGSLVISMGGNELFRFPINATFAGRPRLRLVPQVQGLIVPFPGVVRSAFFQGEREIGYWEFPVQRTEPSQQGIVQAQPLPPLNA